MQTYAAIDLHSNNGVLTIIDETDRVLKQRRIPNKLEEFIKELEPFRATLQRRAQDGAGLLRNRVRPRLQPIASRVSQ